MSTRHTRLADILVSHSIKVQNGMVVLIDAIDVPEDFTQAVIKGVHARGGIAIVETRSSEVMRRLYMECPDDGLRLQNEWEKYRMGRVDAYIGIRGGSNIFTMSDVPHGRMKFVEQLKDELDQIRLKLPWVVLRYPTSLMAQQANMSTEGFLNFYFRVCTMNYKCMAEAAQVLKERMERTDRVRITGSETELEFSIRGISAMACSGEYNIPDGECFTAPVRDSVNGVIAFNVPTIYQDVKFNGIKLNFRDGKIIAAAAESRVQTIRLNEILDSDEGARYVGEFSLAFNPYITQPMLDILFDEKIAGSVHVTPGHAYERFADNGNRSQVHWDMVMIQTPEYGGGEIWFDGELIRKDGRFVTPDLLALNPENLKGGE